MLRVLLYFPSPSPPRKGLAHRPKYTTAVVLLYHSVRLSVQVLSSKLMNFTQLLADIAAMQWIGDADRSRLSKLQTFGSISVSKRAWLALIYKISEMISLGCVGLPAWTLSATLWWGWC